MEVTLTRLFAGAFQRNCQIRIQVFILIKVLQSQALQESLPLLIALSLRSTETLFALASHWEEGTMALRRVLILVAILAGFVGHAWGADSARLTGGRGHLATRVPQADWQGVRLGDSIPTSSHLRTSPLAPVRIDLPSGVLCLAGATDLDLEIDTRRIVIERGRILMRNRADQTSWTVIAGSVTFVCPPGSEVEITYAETIGANLLQGDLKVVQKNGEAATHKAPLEWIGNDQGISKSSLPANDRWAAHIRLRTEPRDEQGMGQLIAKDSQSDSPVRLEIARYHVNVVLQPPVALVQIDQSFFNPYSRQEEGTFVFNLPEGASVSRFAMFVTPDQLIEGELIDRNRANQVYTTIVRSKRDPAILEQIGSNLFRMRVFPIFARDTKRILLDYTIPLVAERGRYHFELPLMSDLKPIWDFGLTGQIHPPFAAHSISSQTHPQLEFLTADDGSASFSWKAKQVQPPPHLLLDFRAKADARPTVRTFTPPQGEQHFVVTLPESANPAPKQDPLPMDMLVLVDTSGGSGDLSRVQTIARTVVENLRPQDRWQLGCVDVNFRPVTSEWMTARSSAARQALRPLDEAFPLGASRLDATIEESLQIFKQSPEDRRRVILYIGNGEATLPSNTSFWANDMFEANRVARPVFNAVKVGDEKLGGTWLKKSALKTGGRVVSCETGSVGLRELFEWSLRGAPADNPIESCSVESVRSEDLFHDSVWPVGRELHVYGRGKPQDRLNLKVKLADRAEQSFPIDVNEVRDDEDVFTGRLWARKKLDSLLEAGTNSDTARLAVVGHCQEWSLMSPYTAFLVLETEADYDRWNIPRQLRHRYWKPAGSVEAVPLPDHLRQDSVAQAPLNPNLTRANDPSVLLQDFASRHLSAAKECLQQGNAFAAMNHLNAIQADARAVDPAMYDSLLKDARKGLQRERTLDQLKIWRPLFDRQAGNPLPPIAPLILNFAYGGVNPEFLERHPHAMKLLRPAPKFDADDVPLTEFLAAIERVIGVPVIVDRYALADEGISTDVRIDVDPLLNVSVRELLNLLLEKFQLAADCEKHVLRITTQAKAAERIHSHVYPVVDLVRSDVLPLPQQLPNPFLERTELQRKRVTELYLKTPISVAFEDNPLNEVLDVIADQVGGPRILIDKTGLADEGMSVDQSVTWSSKNLSADIVMDEILRPMQLQHMIRDGVIVVTTQAKADELMETRVYSGAGLVNDTVLVPAANRHQIPFGFGGGMMGVGGGMMGGGGFFGGGMGGGLGGGMVAAMGGGGFFGGGGGGGGGDPVPAGGNIGLSDVAAPQFDEPEPQSVGSDPSDPFLKSAEASNPPVPNSSARRLPSFAAPFPFPQFSWYQPYIGYDVFTPMQLIRRSTSSKWEDEDGEGGSIGFHGPSFTFVVRQTQQVHRQIQELVKNLRRQPHVPPTGGSPAFKRIGLDDPRNQGYSNLMNLIRQSTSGKWVDDDGEGGAMSPHPLTNSLVIGQQERVHEEIDELFSQLRRARYIAESLPWMSSLDGIDDLVTFLLDRPVVTDLPRNSIPDKRADKGTGDAQKMLAVRKVAGAIDQTWRSVSKSSERPLIVTIRHHDGRLQLELPDRIFRAEGPRAAVAYPGLTLVEINAWGDAVRSAADSLLPWMPHRSNDELGRIFDVTVESDEASTSTLRLTFPDHADTYLKATFSKQTGSIVKWQSFVSEELQYELQVGSKSVVAVDSANNELERWELIADAELRKIAEVGDEWDDFLVVNTDDPDAPVTKARNAIRSGDPFEAITILEQLRVERPQQPLLNFLLARSFASVTEPTPNQKQTQQGALERLAVSGTEELLRLLRLENFPSISASAFRNILLKVPEKQRTDDLWNQSIELAIKLNRIDLALKELDRAIEQAPDATTRIRRQISRVELLLRNQQPDEAESAADEVAQQGASNVQLLELGDIFGKADRLTAASRFFERYLSLPTITLRDRCDVAYRQATWLKKGEARWRYLIEADSDKPQAEHGFLSLVLTEADQREDAEVLGKLANELKPGYLRARLLIHQADLALDRDKSAQIGWSLYQASQLPESHISWVIEKLRRANRTQGIVEILERRLRLNGKVTNESLEILAAAYRTLGRDIDARRAATEMARNKK